MTCFSSQPRRLPLMSRRLPVISPRLSMVLNNFRKRRYGARRPREVRRPFPRFAIEPHRLHAGLRRAHHIGQRIIADMHYLMRLDARLLQQPREYARVRFRRARRSRRHVSGEQIRDATAPEVGIAIAEREQAIARA